MPDEITPAYMQNWTAHGEIPRAAQLKKVCR
jgi:hypothetical protein